MKKNKTPLRQVVKDFLVIFTLVIIDLLLLIFTLALMGVGV